jgi:hypothetical protein
VWAVCPQNLGPLLRRRQPPLFHCGHALLRSGTQLESFYSCNRREGSVSQDTRRRVDRRLLAFFNHAESYHEIESEATDGSPTRLPGLPQETRSQEAADKLRGHLDLMDKEDLIEIEHSSLANAFVVKGLTPKGRNFLDSIR